MSALIKKITPARTKYITKNPTQTLSAAVYIGQFVVALNNIFLRLSSRELHLSTSRL
ncbi:MAG: hypothetical protein ACOZBL_05900 [Patescibacteria group bacterium]